MLGAWQCMNHFILKQMVRIAHCANRRSRTVDKDRLSEWKRIFAVILKIFILFSDFIKSSQHTIRKIKFLSKNSTLISRENCRFYWLKNSWKCCGFGHSSWWQLWFHEKNCQKKIGLKTRENVGVLSKFG